MKVNDWGYELIPLDEPESAPTGRKSVYAAMLTEFVSSPYKRVLVEYGDRNGQAIYMGLRQVRARDPRFADVRIRKAGSAEKARVFLERD